MRVCITTTSREVSDYVYDLLTNPLSGHGCLSGCKKCLDDHNMSDHIMEFDLEQHEVDELKKIEGVERITLSGLGKPTIQAWSTKYKKVRTPNVQFRNASYTYSDNQGSTSPSSAGLSLGPIFQHYATNYNPTFAQNVASMSTGMTSAFSIDCQDVDILLLDTGVDPSCEELKDIYGNNLVQIFDWTQVVDGITPYDYYTDTDPNSPTFGQVVQAPNYVVFENEDDPQNINTSNILANYYVDWIGHGTECASLIAGYKCGMAKNARIYALNCKELGAPFGFKFITCLKLAAGFLLGKLNGWYGLNPRRPTIFSNSWTVEGPRIAGASYLASGTGYTTFSVGPLGIPSGKTKPISAMWHGFTTNTNIHGYNNDGLMSAGFGTGGINLSGGLIMGLPSALSACNQPLNTALIYQNNIPAYDDVVDEYMRILTQNGMHVVVCAGNNNIDLNQQTAQQIPILYFRDTATSMTYAVLRQMVLDSDNRYKDNGLGLALGQNYVINGTTYNLYASGNTPLNYISPDIGIGQNRDTYPLIKVGCVTPLNNVDTAVSTYDSGGYSRAFFNLLYSNNSYHPTQVSRQYLGRVTTVNPGQENRLSAPGLIDCGFSFYRSSSTPTAPFSSAIATRFNGVDPYFLYFGYDGAAIPPVGILYNDGVNNTNLGYRFDQPSGSLVDPVYVKSPYSNFGPAVDIYAVGNASWAGFSNQTLDPAGGFYTLTGRMSSRTAPPFFKDASSTLTSSTLWSNLTSHGSLYKPKYKFVNGTSAACPAVAGCLATFLAENPKATPLEAKRWLLNSSIKGKILTTNRTPYVSSLSGFDATRGGWGVTFGPDSTGVAKVTSVNFGSFGYNHNLQLLGLGPSSGSFIIGDNRVGGTPWAGVFVNNNSPLTNFNASTCTTHCAPTQFFRNTNFYWTSAYYDKLWGKLVNNFVFSDAVSGTAIINQYGGGLDFYYPFSLGYMQNFFFQCRFFKDSNNRVVQAHPLRSGVFYATTGTTYASAIYLKQNGVNVASTRLHIGSLTTELTTHTTGTEYIITNLNQPL